jgi:uncharacterized membrane protein
MTMLGTAPLAARLDGLPRRRFFFDGIVLVGATLCLLTTLMDWSDNPLRIATGLLLSLFGPGYALLQALFPTGPNLAERFGLSVPASFVLAVLVGAFANATFGLSQSIIVLLLWAVTVGLLGVAYARLVRMPASRRAEDPFGAARGGQSARFRPRFGLGGVVATLLVLVVGFWAVASVVSATHVSAKPFTALSVDGASGVQQSDTPLSVTLDNEEGKPMQYDLQVRVGGREVSRINRIAVDSGAQYSLTLPLLAVDGPGADVIAYRSGDSQPYRVVHVSGAVRDQ